VQLTFSDFNAHICTSCCVLDHDEFLPPVVKLSTTPYCTYISSSQYDGTHYNNSTQFSNQYTSTDCTSLPLHGNSPSTCPSNVSAHNNRQIDSAHFVVSMPYDRHTSPSLVSVCNDRPTDSIHIVPYVDTIGSRQCNTEHTSTEGVARNGNVLVTNSNPVSTHASTGSVNPYPNKVHCNIFLRYIVRGQGNDYMCWITRSVTNAPSGPSSYGTKTETEMDNYSAIYTFLWLSPSLYKQKQI
jgi:hypothetical protein